jgi:hypothetical protein
MSLLEDILILLPEEDRRKCKARDEKLPITSPKYCGSSSGKNPVRSARLVT